MYGSSVLEIAMRMKAPIINYSIMV